ncbi:MAG TPA: hypothetical protein DHV69_05105 [Sphaerochaeta sp.]|nr:hypothetical protein [Sphaerochaeta sp.]
MIARTHFITSMLVLLLVAVTGTISASAIGESPSASALWEKADDIADNSEQYLPGIRRISYQETDGKGVAVYADQAVVLIEGSHYDRYLQVREFGDAKIFDLMARYTDGMVLTPFSDNVYDMDYTYTGVTEQVLDTTTEVFTFSMAYDESLPYYDPNYRESEKILGWDDDEDDFDGTIEGTIWLDKVSGAPIKMVTLYYLEDNSSTGTLVLEQSVYFDSNRTISTPAKISTKGTLTVQAGSMGRIAVTDFTITEEQDAFWYNSKFARGEIVN